MNRELLITLLKKDIKDRYLGSYLGVFWLVIQPVISIFIFWFVFQVGFKTASVGEHPFFLWLVAGILPWFYFSEAFSSASSSVIEQANLIKKISFNSLLLPIVKIINSLFIHVFFLVLFTIIALSYGYNITFEWISLLYYLACLILLTTGVSLITSSLNPFIRDIGQIVGVLVQFGFWLTPIFWNLNTIPERFQKLFEYNPVYYIVKGYRDVVLDNTPFWSEPQKAILFLCFVIILNVVGLAIFRKLRPHYPDVL
ncbi:ABC transporter permease [Vibrio crassostreae]|uniref:ABC transporter permease n=1 Tax=Vibrio crassostreae TaxID=246167 RepID=UPI000F4A88A8|nr:ABC transporter permease [Vibrio crassostreae]ROP20111.1 lipopolysaccharide transport system permease protein/teichoic acid transport system permease protein [Vibrio crassostreae]ROP21798.1 lipopolysaccharide transport system permease protein/teichoic acid transport system permease protein [Vibrio crassostreae]RPE97636.1 lipopolysaccharide transport system permease protein/teichoic acid transport system permease protein [Vibrio crassostreae]RPE99941.1 lipopolysaccharide transport system perm